MVKVRNIFFGLLWAVAAFTWFWMGAWTALAVYFGLPVSIWIATGAALGIALLYLIALRERKKYKLKKSLRPRDVPLSLAATLLSGAVAIWYFGFIKPDPDQNWASEHSRMPHVRIEGNLVHIDDVRNFSWRSRTDFTPGFYSRTYDMDKIDTMYYLVVPMNRLDGIAHVMVCFAFTDGQAVTISVEGRRVEGRPYRVIQSMFRQYQLIYVMGDERDVVGVRGAVWQQPVRMYPAKTTQARKRAIFLDMVERAHSLEEKPEFYNLITNNCMNNITWHLRRLGGRPLPSDLAVLLTGLSDRVAYRFGYFDTQLPFEKAREAFRVDGWMRTTLLDESFSTRLRETLRRQEAEWAAKK